jgi:hypothetical protein
LRAKTRGGCLDEADAIFKQSEAYYKQLLKQLAILPMLMSMAVKRVDERVVPKIERLLLLVLVLFLAPVLSELWI